MQLAQTIYQHNHGIDACRRSLYAEFGVQSRVGRQVTHLAPLVAWHIMAADSGIRPHVVQIVEPTPAAVSMIGNLHIRQPSPRGGAHRLRPMTRWQRRAVVRFLLEHAELAERTLGFLARTGHTHYRSNTRHQVRCTSRLMGLLRGAWVSPFLTTMENEPCSDLRLAIS